MPVLGLLFAGTIFCARAYLRYETTLAAARRCAYEYAVDGCRDLPASCRVQPDVSQSEQGKASSEQVVSSARVSMAGPWDVFDRVPVIGTTLRALFGTTASVDVPFELERPMSQETAHFHARISLACNTAPLDVNHEVKNFFRSLISLAGL